jgi:hypothetical protein
VSSEQSSSSFVLVLEGADLSGVSSQRQGSGNPVLKRKLRLKLNPSRTRSSPEGHLPELEAPATWLEHLGAVGLSGLVGCCLGMGRRLWGNTGFSP